MSNFYYIDERIFYVGYRTMRKAKMNEKSTHDKYQIKKRALKNQQSSLITPILI